ncbi:exodeoxyribonuclease V subunit beta [Bradyrhizobium arachidis]|uniref:UvrD-helicase domain-containing protein n=1 Tax=Bradyrhizobium arachidis TaxID=858423 RepID=UPI0021619C64|nr:UvrD-helicase domain-containing protein [Bradyrhizobium arachidis]UVO30329.1 UvrD-helicase domain-containing protein [Bradyrhizobium arachidis]
MIARNDDSDRLRALTEFDSTLLVEAAAGTGKTSLLAGRVVMLLAAGTPPKSMAAITFTELAAGELRQRIAHYLDALLLGKVPEELRLCIPTELESAQRRALEKASGLLDELTCSTIHGFCHDLLRTYSVEAGIDPDAEILDRDQADFVFDAIFDQWWRDRLDEPRPAEDAITVIARKDPTGAEKLLRDFAKSRRRHRNARPLPPGMEVDAHLDFGENVREFRRWYDRVGGPCDVVDLETLVGHFERSLQGGLDFARLWDAAHPETLPLMRSRSLDLREYRRRSMWKRAKGDDDGGHLADQAEEHYARCRESYGTLMGRIATAIVSVFSSELDGLLAEYDGFKRRAAVMDFDDLLFTCREVLRRYPEVRAAAGGRFSRILVDEFQDTDPVQAEILFLLAGADATTENWQERRLRRGQLFLVGDPKQAIYRFRGADLATYLKVRSAIEAQFPENILRVTANFRSRPRILEYINDCFAGPLAAQQAGYVALGGTRDDANHGLPCVTKVSVDLLPNTRIDSSRDEEARVVAEICGRLIGNVVLKLNDGSSRRLTPGDIALLAPVSTELWRYERALEEAGLPFASQAGKNLFKRQEAQDLVALVRAIADVRDTLALGALLRGPLVGLSEQELLTITANLPVPPGSESARLSLLTDPKIVQNDLAREVLGILRDIRLRLRVTTPALLLAEAIERLRVRAIVAARSADQASRSLANVDALLERARNYGVRGFVQFARDLDDDWSSGTGFPEGIVEADGRSIEIVTVHSSKGLEWPVVIPINRASMPRPPEAFVYRRSDESLHWALGQVTPPTLQGALQGENREKRDENLRLLYVACTRAMELLVIPEFSWCDETSWAKQIDFKLEGIPKLDVSKFERAAVVSPEAGANLQSAELFAEEQSRIERDFPSIVWTKPSESDPDTLPTPSPNSAEEEVIETTVKIEGGRLRGVILHKLMEELATGELAADADEAAERAHLLCEQLATETTTSAGPDPAEMANTALRTFAHPQLKPFRDRLVAEVPLYGIASAGSGELVAGRADAVAQADNGDLVAFDWKSDVAPNERDRSAYRAQLAHYLRVLGAQRGAVVYMTSGHIDWIAAAA